MKNYNEISKSVLSRRDKYEEVKRMRRQNISQISIIAVCLIAVTATGFAIVRKNWLKMQFAEFMQIQISVATDVEEPSSGNDVTASPTTTAPALKGTTVPAKDVNLQSTTSDAEIYNEISWEEKSMPGKFCTLGIGNTQHLNAIDESDVSGSVREYVYPFGPLEERATLRQGTMLVAGVQIEGREPDGTAHTALVDIFSLSGLSEDLALGVRFPDDDRIYTYVSSSYIPATLGEFLDAINYDNTVTYGAITLFPGNNFPVNNENAKDVKSYLLSEKSARNIMDANAEATGQCVTVSISCSELGRYSKTLCIYEDGHITTNLIGYEYSFFVGKDAVDSFLKNSYNISFEEIKQVNAETTIPVEEWWTTAPTTQDYSQVTDANEEAVSDTTISQAITQAFAVSDADISVVEAEAENEIIADTIAVTE